jgi:phage shock protein C
MKRLYRSEKNRVFAGVIGGLGEYFGVDPVFMRLAWLLVLFATGVFPGLIVYFIAILVVPRHPGPHPHHEPHHTT